ncbi:MAG: phosphoglycolate phosphatase, partial [Thermoleophilaceae bacterium]|nr:phosphoglycolate phosphatase [Thermoleophilaceae bacterium]
RRLGREKGVLLGITSGAVEAAAHIKLARAGFNRYFPFGGYGSDSADRVELTRRAIEKGSALIGDQLDPQHVFVVGDTPKDIEAAHGAGCVGVGTATGHYSREELEAAGAEYVVGSLHEPFPELS